MWVKYFSYDGSYSISNEILGKALEEGDLEMKGWVLCVLR